MGLIDDDVVKIIRRELVKFRGKRDNHGEEACCVSFAMAGKLAVRISVAENALEAFHRSVEDSLPMGDKEHALRRACGDIERRKIRFACSCG